MRFTQGRWYNGAQCALLRPILRLYKGGERYQGTNMVVVARTLQMIRINGRDWGQERVEIFGRKLRWSSPAAWSMTSPTDS